MNSMNKKTCIVTNTSMTSYLHCICCFVLTGFVLTACARYISDPRFYRNNTQRCNCKNNLPCDFLNGRCPGGKCAYPYIGINCQHASAILKGIGSSKNIPWELLDGDDTTCVRHWDGNATFIVKKSIFIWIYIFKNSTKTITPRIRTYDNNVNQRFGQTYEIPIIFRINSQSVLLKLHKRTAYTHLELSDLAMDACSIDISIGRNLAISSTLLMPIFRNIIDGNDFNPCLPIQAYGGRIFERWELRLLHNATINRISILSHTVTTCAHLMLSVHVKSKDMPRQKSGLLKVEHETIFDNIYTQMIEKVYIRLYGQSDSQCRHKVYAHICEIYVYGEYHCPPMKYGPMCEIDSPCGYGLCDPDWGCPSGCNIRGPWATQSLRQMFDSNTVIEQDTVTLTCDAKRAAPGEVLPSIAIVTQLEVSKKGPNENDFKEFARYSYVFRNGMEKKVLSQEIRNSSGRIVATFEGMFPNGKPISPNVNLMKIVIRFEHILRDDEAIYRCGVTYQLLTDAQSRDKQIESQLTISDEPTPTTTATTTLIDVPTTTTTATTTMIDVPTTTTTATTTIIDVPTTTTTATTTMIECRFRYGEYCEHMCPGGCAGLGECDKTTGTCLHGCRAGYHPPFCTAVCPPGTFDVNCSKTCFNCDTNQTTHEYACDAVSGECLLGCAIGFDGEDCERIIEFEVPWLEVMSFFIAGFVIILIIINYKYITREGDDLHNEDNEVDEESIASLAESGWKLFRDETEDVKKVQYKSLGTDLFGAQGASSEPGLEEELEIPNTSWWTYTFEGQPQPELPSDSLNRTTTIETRLSTIENEPTGEQDQMSNEFYSNITFGVERSASLRILRKSTNRLPTILEDTED